MIVIVIMRGGEGYSGCQDRKVQHCGLKLRSRVNLDKRASAQLSRDNNNPWLGVV